MAERLKAVIDSVISPVQTAFIKGRSILDGPLIVNEILSWLRRSKKKALIFKVDFEKAFDCISWEFLDSVIEQMNLVSGGVHGFAGVYPQQQSRFF